MIRPSLCSEGDVEQVFALMQKLQDEIASANGAGARVTLVACFGRLDPA